MSNLVYRHQSALQAVSPSRAHGIVMPFNVRSKHDTFANETTEFGLDLFPHKPFLFMHMLDGKLEVHGEVLVMEIRPKVGLWADVEIDEFAHGFIQSKRSGFSTGSLAQLVAVTANGFLTRWVVVELSFAEEKDLANRPGTTTAMLQSFCPGLESHSLTEENVSRGIWIMSLPENVPEPAAPPPESSASPPAPPPEPPAPLPPPALAPAPPVASALPPWTSNAPVNHATTDPSPLPERTSVSSKCLNPTLAPGAPPVQAG